MNFIKIYADGFHDHWDLTAMTDYATGRTVTYGNLVERIHRMHLLLEELDVSKGARVAVVGRNSIEWIYAYMGVITQGATAVTLPPLGETSELLSYLADAEVEYLFVDRDIVGADGFDIASVPMLKAVISIDTRTLLAARPEYAERISNVLASLDDLFAAAYPYGFKREHAVVPPLAPDDVVAIFFTSGTVRRPRGVMLMADNLEGNIIHGMKINLFPPGSDAVTATTLGTVWGTVFNVLVPLASGAHLIITDRVNDPAALADVFMRYKPDRLMLSTFALARFYDYARRVNASSELVRLTRRLPGGSWIENVRLRRTINRLLGGRYREIMIGYTPMGQTLSYRLRRAGVRFTVIYGLTECGGLVSYSPYSSYRSGTAGHIISGLLRCRVRPIDYKGLPPGAGELEVKGMTVMKGYIGPGETPEIPLTGDGWLQTDDICTITSHGDITVVGRKSTLIHLDRGVVSPERLQTILYENPEIAECVVMGCDGRVKVMVYPDYKELARRHGDQDVESVIRGVVSDVNRTLSFIERIDDIEIAKETLHLSFKKTVARYYYCPTDY